MKEFNSVKTTFPSDDFLLTTPTAKALYEKVRNLPIIDYHCHLPVKQIYDDHRFENITELWLAGDHYKWRAMRAHGIPEKYITGDATPREKFRAWASTLPYTMRNPLYHWSAMELQTAFGIDVPLDAETADAVYDHCNAQLGKLTARNLIRHYNVEALCTTDDPIDTLEYHAALALDKNLGFKVLPAWRPDKALATYDLEDYRMYLNRLGAAASMPILNLDDMLAALQSRHDHFAANGCVMADHGLSRVPSAAVTRDEAAAVFDLIIDRQPVTEQQLEKLNTLLLDELLAMNSRAGWTQQLHVGPLRNVNTRAYATLGPDAGYDTIGALDHIEPLARLLDRMATAGTLAPTIIYDINAAANDAIAALAATFNDGTAPGRVQQGAAWWFNDNLDGMRRQLNSISNQSLLAHFNGMLTDSRSLLSYTRHDYFRRLLCDILGNDYDNGLIHPAQLPRLQEMACDIAYNNSRALLIRDTQRETTE